MKTIAGPEDGDGVVAGILTRNTWQLGTESLPACRQSASEVCWSTNTRSGNGAVALPLTHF